MSFIKTFRPYKKGIARDFTEFKKPLYVHDILKYCLLNSIYPNETTGIVLVEEKKARIKNVFQTLFREKVFFVQEDLFTNEHKHVLEVLLMMTKKAIENETIDFIRRYMVEFITLTSVSLEKVNSTQPDFVTSIAKYANCKLIKELWRISINQGARTFRMDLYTCLQREYKDYLVNYGYMLYTIDWVVNKIKR